MNLAGCIILVKFSKLFDFLLSLGKFVMIIFQEKVSIVLLFNLDELGSIDYLPYLLAFLLTINRNFSL